MKRHAMVVFGTILLFMVGCSKDKDSKPNYKINLETLTTNYDGEHQFTITGNPENVEWVSSDEEVGAIDETGLFKASRIGNTTITARIGSSTVTSEITVESYGEFFKEPYTAYGDTKIQIKSKEKRTILEEAVDGILFGGENDQVDYLLYQFESGEMVSATVIFNNSSTTGMQIGRFYAERYTYLGSDDEFVYINDNKGSIIGIGVTNLSEFFATYISASSLQASSVLKAIKKGGSLKLKMQELHQSSAIR